MGDMTSQSPSVLPLFVGTLGFSPAMGMLNPLVGGPPGVSNTSRTWVDKLVQYNPMVIPFDYPVSRVWWVNGSTITTTNVQFGIYSEDGTLLYTTGTVAASGASSAQYVSVATPFILAAGRYYFAWTCNNTTNRGNTFSATNVNYNVIVGLLEETTGSFGLPATMTPVRFTRAWGPNVCGVTRTATGF